MLVYSGNSNRGISKSARYTVTASGEIRLKYFVGKNEFALLATGAHRELVDMVNGVKAKHGDGAGGAFIINEFRHVVVPVRSGETSQSRYAGFYGADLTFPWEGQEIGPRAPSSLRAGQLWPGPRVGVKYKVTANCRDIAFEYATARGTVKTEALSDTYAAGELTDLLDMVRRVKPQGGALYINEAGELFAPQTNDAGLDFVYVGARGKHAWFPEPDVE